jgi:diacylglycerol kinase family enzyme
MPTAKTIDATAKAMEASVVVIVNASAHSEGAAHVASELDRYFGAAGIRTEIKLAKSGRNVAEEVGAAILRKPRTIVVGGGDGTLSCGSSAAGRKRDRSGRSPLGTFNHFAKDLHIPLDLERAVTTIAEGHMRARRRRRGQRSLLPQ